MNFSTNLAAAKLPIKLPIKLKNDAERVFFVCLFSLLSCSFVQPLSQTQIPQSPILSRDCLLASVQVPKTSF